MSVMDQSWVKVQQKAFTRWVNAHLGKRGIQVEDLQTAFKTGINLIQLLEVIGEHTFGRHNKNPRMEIQMRENIEIALKFIESRDVKLTAIGAGDIYSGNLKLILGMVWTVILRFAIAEISVEELTAKEALLLWCQRKTADYDNVDIKEFTWSWQDGLGFCALIHKHRPDLIDYESLDGNDKEGNLNLAFEVAEKELGIPKFLDAEDMIEVKPDERAVMTYLAEYFKVFSKGQKAENAGRRINKVVELVMALEEQKNGYNDVANDLVEQLNNQIGILDDRNFADTIQGVKEQLDEFKEYKRTVKPELIRKKLEVNSDLGKLNTRLRVNNRNLYTPPEGLSAQEIEQLWDVLVESETNRSKALRDHLQKLNRELLDELEGVARDYYLWAQDTKNKISGIEGDIDTQIQEMDGVIEEINNNAYRLDKAKELSDRVTDASLEYYTEVSYDVLESSYNELLKFAQDQRSLLENQKFVNEGAKVTQEQLDEFKQMFELFDKDKKGSLYPYEFAGVLNALGDDLSEEEMKQVFDKYDSDGSGTLEFNEFVDFMTGRIEDSDTAEQILQSWKIVSKDKSFVEESDMGQAQLKKNVMEFVKERSNPLESGYDYDTFTNEVLYN
ncbi:alpha-actinin-2 [Anaeramoeba flamelloides]|uniref:Alpha-actinin-2 n=1 Tax=Anaeramoeba flamelloides TaxID=1746091 RepID=A0ABQ8X7S5_9EUKA|nr:alpha-actinin-2 [Anaeramoeba flamelloides]